MKTGDKGPLATTTMTTTHSLYTRVIYAAAVANIIF